MKIGFNRDTLELALNFLMLAGMIRGALLVSGYWLPKTPLNAYELQGTLLVVGVAVAYLWVHRLLEEFDKPKSS